MTAPEAASRLSEALGPLRRPGAFQIGFLVEDIDAGCGLHCALWGIEEWRCFVYGPETVPRLTYRDRPGTYSMKVALGGASPQVELVEPLTGPSIYEEWLERGGGSLHHVAYAVESLEQAITAMRKAGIDVLQSGAGYGLDGDGGYAYFDTEGLCGAVIEAIEVPSRRREPDWVWRLPA